MYGLDFTPLSGTSVSPPPGTVVRTFVFWCVLYVSFLLYSRIEVDFSSQYKLSIAPLVQEWYIFSLSFSGNDFV